MRPTYLLFLTVIFLCQQGIRAPLPLGLKNSVDHVLPLGPHDNPYKVYDHDLLNMDVPKMEVAAPKVPLDYAALSQKDINVVFSSKAEDQETVKTSGQDMSPEEFKKKFLEYFATKYQKLQQAEGYEY